MQVEIIKREEKDVLNLEHILGYRRITNMEIWKKQRNKG